MKHLRNTHRFSRRRLCCTAKLTRKSCRKTPTEEPHEQARVNKGADSTCWCHGASLSLDKGRRACVYDSRVLTEPRPAVSPCLNTSSSQRHFRLKLTSEAHS